MTKSTIQIRTVGFTLLEFVIALFIFSIGIMAAISLQIVNRNQLSFVRKNLNDSLFAAAFIETIIGLDYEDSLLTDTDAGYSLDTPDHGPFKFGNQNSTVEWEIDDDFPVKRIKRITIIIRRTDLGGSKRILRYEYAKASDFI